MNGTGYLHLLKLAAPEALVVLAALGALFVDVGVMREQGRRTRRLLGAAIATLGAFAAGLGLLNLHAYGTAMGGMFATDPLTQWTKVVVLALTGLTAILSVETDFTEHVGEYFALLLLATTGLMFMVSATDVLMVFLSLELTSLSLYSLAALNKASPRSAEAALKYFFFGALAAAFALYGFSLLYGIAGTTNLAGIAASVRGRGFDPLLAAAMLMVIVGFGFKVAAVPFHLWAPDAYQGAPTPAAALIASGSKVASFFLLGKVLTLALPENAGRAALGHFGAGWMPVLAVLALASMLLGNLAALAQHSLKRLLAYSAIAHAGTMLLGVLALAGAANRAEAYAALLFYAATYGLTTVGAFGVAAVAERLGEGDGIAGLTEVHPEDFVAPVSASGCTGLAGLARRSPWLAACLLVMMLSLAGLPPFAGFPAKFYVFAAALKVDATNLDLLWLAVVGLALSPVALYYYLKVLKQAYMVAPNGTEMRWKLRWPEALAIGLAAAGVLILGIAPGLLLDSLSEAIRAAGL